MIPPLGIRFEFSGPTAAMLHLGYERPIPREVRGARTGLLRLGLLPAGKHTLFLLVQQDYLLKGWADAPFAWSKVATKNRYLPVEHEESSRSARGYLFNVVMTDERGIVHALRVTSVTPRFTAILDAALREQEWHANDFSVAAHDAEVEAAYRRWPTANAMASAAAIVEVAGMQFSG
jgi:hypothetical protein